MWDNKINHSNVDPKPPKRITKDLNHSSIRNGVLKWSCDGASCKTMFHRILSSEEKGDENLESPSSSKSGIKLPPLYKSLDNGNSTFASSASRSVRSSKDSSETLDMCELITEDWKLPKEIELIVWLVGPLKDKNKEDEKKMKTKNDAPSDDASQHSTDDELQPNKREIQILTEHIMKITADTESWLFVQANDTNLFDYVEGAMDKHELIARNKPAHVIGVTCWPYEGRDMCDEVEFFKTQRSRQDDKMKGDVELLEHYALMYSDPKKGRCKLSPSIKQHIFLDYETDFQTLMSENTKTMDLNDVFQCAIVINGDDGTLKVLNRKMDKGIPIILVEKSGGLADKLIDIKNNKSNHGEDKYLDIANYNHLEVFSDKEQCNDACIREKILLSIKKANPSIMEQSTTTTKYMRKVHFYKLCTELNMLKVLKKEPSVNRKELKWKENRWLTRIIFEAVKQGHVEFVKFFIDENFDMKSAFSHQKLHELYQTKTEEPKKLSKVASHVNKLLGGSYHMNFPTPVKEEEENGSYHQDQELYLDDRNKNALRDLFIWSVLAKKFELSKCLWHYLDHQTAAAMFAFGVAKAMRTSTTLGNRNDESILEDYKRYFTNLACETIDSTFTKHEEKTFDILTLKMSKWGQTSCVRLALDSRNKEFLSTEACKQLCNRLWWRGQEVNTLSNQEVEHRSKQESCCGPGSGCIKYLSTPLVIFWLQFLGLIIFLLIYGVLLVSELDMASFSWLEWLVWSWVIVYILEAIRLKVVYINKRIKVKNLSTKERPSKFDKFKSLFQQSYSKVVRKSNLPEWINLISYILFLLAWSFRCAAYYYPDVRDQLGGTASVLFSLDYICFCLRLFEFFYVSKFLGLLVAMITQMAITLFKFLIILFVFFVAFAVASESVIYPQSQLRGPGLFYLFRIAYWSMFGDHFLDDIAVTNSTTECTRDASIYNTYTEVRCPTDVGRYYVPILMAVYVMVTNILLFNLVIAKFNSTIDKIEKEAELVWNFQQFKRTLEFSKGVLLPPPFLLLSVIIYLTKSRSDICVKEIKEKHMRKKLLRLEKMSIEEYNNTNNLENSSKSETKKEDATESSVSRQPESNLNFELLGLKKENVPDNGDSIFWAIIVQTDNGVTPKKLREKVCGYIKEKLRSNELDDFEQFDGWEDVLNKTGHWDQRLSGVVLESVANILKRNIVTFSTDKNCPLRVIPTTEGVVEDEGQETYIALYYEHEKEHYDALLTRTEEKRGGRRNGTILRLYDCLAQLNLKRDSDTDKAENNVYDAASNWLSKCPVEASDVLASLVASYIENHGLSKTDNGQGSYDDKSSDSGASIDGTRRSAANESLEIKSLSELMETHVVIVSYQKSQALSLISPMDRAMQLLYKKVVFCATFAQSGKVDYYHVTQSDGSNCDENRWRKGKPSTGLLDTRLKRMGLEKVSKPDKDMFTAIADQEPMASIDELKETVMQELVINPKSYQEKSKSDKEGWTNDRKVFLTDHNINDTFVDTVARATATVLGKNILIVLSDPSCPFYLVSPTNKKTAETLYLARMQLGQSGAYYALSPNCTDLNKESGYDKLRRSGTGNRFDAARLRRKVCKHFKKNALDYQNIYTLSPEDWEKELKILSESGRWNVHLGDLVPKALAKVLDRPIVILHDDPKRVADEFYPDKPIYLVRQSDHYHAAVKRKVNDAGSIEDQDVPISSKLKTMLDEKGLQLIPIAPDGNCMFEAVAIQL